MAVALVEAVELVEVVKVVEVVVVVEVVLVRMMTSSPTSPSVSSSGEALKDVVAVASLWSDIARATGRQRPDVIT